MRRMCERVLVPLWLLQLCRKRLGVRRSELSECEYALKQVTASKERRKRSQAQVMVQPGGVLPDTAVAMAELMAYNSLPPC